MNHVEAIAYLDMHIYVEESVSVVFDYRLDDPGSIPAEANDFSSSLSVQTNSEVHPASSPTGRVTCGRSMTLTTHPI
jgi:hypothetical protein